jgi:hypothetical protein
MPNANYKFADTLRKTEKYKILTSRPLLQFNQRG